jgi:crotonobetaine/carnitine-CoA ligase
MTNRFANGFAELGIGKGDHVAVLLGNGPEFFWTIWGLGKLGAVAVPVNTAAKGELLRYFIDQSDSQWIVVDEESAQRVAAIADKVPRIRGVLYHGPKAPASCGIVAPSAPVLALSELARASAARPPVDAVRHDDLHLIMYTSGTTGPSKGVMSPHAQGHGVGWSLAKFFGYRPNDVIYTCLPLFHGNALWYSAYAALWAEAALAVAPRFSATQFWDDIRRFGATQFNTLGAMTNILWKLPPSPADHDHRLRLCMTVPVPKEIYQELQQRYHVQITSVYAMTENCAVTLFTADDPPAKAGAAGKTRGYAEIRIVTMTGRMRGARRVRSRCGPRRA